MVTRAILWIAGFNLIQLQYFITREFSGILTASEVTILIVATAYFCGFSVGYGVSRILSAAIVRLLAMATFFIHMAILTFIKTMAVMLIQAGFGLEVLVGLVFLAAFFTSAFYCIFLPKFVQRQGGRTLGSAYTWELLGGSAGVVAICVLSAHAPQLLWPCYFALLLALILLLLRRTRWALPYAIVGLFAIGLLVRFQPPLRIISAEDYFHTRNYRNPRLIFAASLLYHNIEVIDIFRDRQRTRPESRVSFINGVKYFDYDYDQNRRFAASTGLSEFTCFLTELPARYLREIKGRMLRVLIMGGGSMYSIRRVRDFSYRTTLVEIDNGILKAVSVKRSPTDHCRTLPTADAHLETLADSAPEPATVSAKNHRAAG